MEKKEPGKPCHIEWGQYDLKPLDMDELEKILSDHEEWLKDNVKGKQATFLKKDLKGYRLGGKNLSGAFFIYSVLSEATLDSSILIGSSFNTCNLSSVSLIEANLENITVINSCLQGAYLTSAILKGSTFRDVDLSKSYLSKANLENADLSGCIIRNAKFYDSNLISAQFEGADLSESILGKCDLRDANLYNANLTNSDLLDANLDGADLRNANLTGAKSLIAHKFAGMDLTGTKLPKDIHNFEGPLSVVEEASKNARNAFFVMLLACVYVLLSVATTTDKALILNDTSSTLPIVGASIPIVYFYWSAPFLLLALYVYFHLYLLRMFENLADLPAVYPDGRPLHKKAYPWLLSGLVCKYFKELRENRPPMSKPQVFLSILLSWVFVPFTFLIMWFRYLPKHDWIWTSIHCLLFTFSISAGWSFYKHVAETLKGNETKNIFLKGFMLRKITVPIPTRFTIINVAVIVATFALMLYSVHFLRKKPIIDFLISKTATMMMERDLPAKQYMWVLPTWVSALLSEQDLSVKPSNWTGEDPAQLNRVKGAKLDFVHLEQVVANDVFLAKAYLRYSRLEGAYMPRAHLEGAQMQVVHLEGALLTEAHLEGADLTKAHLEGADLTKAHLEGAHLTEAHLEDVYLRDTHLEGADLSNIHDLTQGQLEKAMGNHETILPAGLTYPAHWE